MRLDPDECRSLPNVRIHVRVPGPAFGKAEVTELDDWRVRVS